MSCSRNSGHSPGVARRACRGQGDHSGSCRRSGDLGGKAPGDNVSRSSKGLSAMASDQAVGERLSELDAAQLARDLEAGGDPDPWAAGVGHRGRMLPAFSRMGGWLADTTDDDDMKGSRRGDGRAARPGRRRRALPPAALWTPPRRPGPPRRALRRVRRMLRWAKRTTTRQAAPLPGGCSPGSCWWSSPGMRASGSPTSWHGLAPRGRDPCRRVGASVPVLGVRSPRGALQKRFPRAGPSRRSCALVPWQRSLLSARRCASLGLLGARAPGIHRKPRARGRREREAAQRARRSDR